MTSGHFFQFGTRKKSGASVRILSVPSGEHWSCPQMLPRPMISSIQGNGFIRAGFALTDAIFSNIFQRRAIHYIGNEMTGEHFDGDGSDWDYTIMLQAGCT